MAPLSPDNSIAPADDSSLPTATPAPTTIIEADRPIAAASVDSNASVTAIADHVRFTLTVGQALDRFSATRRRLPSERSIQRYCIEGRIAAQKIRTTYGSEWLINERSLEAFIQQQPVIIGDDGDANQPPTATQMPATPAQSQEHRTPDGIASADGDATDVVAIVPQGEHRSLAEVLIENAKLFAQVEGRDGIIAELKEDRNFLREEVREARRSRDDVKNIAERMLDTLKTIAVGRLGAAPQPPPDPIRATFTEQ